ncbi:hypothetical protein PoB_002447100 [Plakobranchus ocellatus]|uniref:Uncharacterized protein n=1 Tax=Plakobranchus ocellatus TaxID=259542 RepID=A0AAV3ZPV3_9GAST|nr:hypothetical protein PoB_002447100 [Plakobranchus ocellatus]
MTTTKHPCHVDQIPECPVRVKKIVQACMTSENSRTSNHNIYPCHKHQTEEQCPPPWCESYNCPSSNGFPQQQNALVTKTPLAVGPAGPVGFYRPCDCRINSNDCMR